ncbi:unnamed protein product [Mytilus coruscus]|uniref:PH domain-containing protein n=1 Tax=Mytilus coruscus TaxID=42192 RepID=A0A6J8EUY5_MYTCO|nr:unnamed protein product [Mytilus coruscus]
MASLKVEDKDVMILRAGYIYRQRTFFKKWRRTWLVVCLGGSVRYYRNRNASRPQKSFDVKNDCIAIKAGKQCKTMLPPKDIDTGCLMEIVLTGDRTLKLCAADPDQSRMWHHAFKRAQSDKQLPTPRHERRNLRPEEIEELEEKSCWYCCCRKNKIQMLRDITSR